jgi:hypothetical protein
VAGSLSSRFIKRIGSTGTAFRGNWANDGKGIKDRHLGLKFYVKGKAHFGWARLTTAREKGHWLRTILTGYAYETIPNKPIVTGQEHGADDSLESSTLGSLALGRK